MFVVVGSANLQEERCHQTDQGKRLDQCECGECPGPQDVQCLRLARDTADEGGEDQSGTDTGTDRGKAEGERSQVACKFQEVASDDRFIGYSLSVRDARVASSV